MYDRVLDQRLDRQRRKLKIKLSDVIFNDQARFIIHIFDIQKRFDVFQLLAEFDLLIGAHRFDIPPGVKREIVDRVGRLFLIRPDKRFDNKQRVVDKVRRYLILQKPYIRIGKLQLLLRQRKLLFQTFFADPRLIYEIQEEIIQVYVDDLNIFDDPADNAEILQKAGDDRRHRKIHDDRVVARSHIVEITKRCDHQHSQIEHRDAKRERTKRTFYKIVFLAEGQHRESRDIRTHRNGKRADQIRDHQKPPHYFVLDQYHVLHHQYRRRDEILDDRRPISDIRKRGIVLRPFADEFHKQRQCHNCRHDPERKHRRQLIFSVGKHQYDQTRYQ